VSDADKTERTQYAPLRSLHAHPRLTFTLIITGTHPNRAPHTSQLSLAPPNDRVNLTHTGYILPPYARYFYLRWLRDISAFFSPLSYSRSLLSCPSLHNHELYSSLSSTMSISTPQLRPRSCPRDTRMIVHTGTKKPPRLPLRTQRRPRPLFTTTKTSAGMSQVFMYVARRVVMRWEWEEAQATGPILSETAALFILVTL
jgi:hypothetical protein